MMITPEIRKEIENAAFKYGLDPDYVEAHIMVESSGEPQKTRFEPAFYKTYIQPLLIKNNLSPAESRGRATSYGLLQIMGQVARELGLEGNFNDLLTVSVGLEWGCKKLAQCYHKYPNDIHAGISAYNCGTPRLLKNGKLKNQEYVDKVLGFLKQIKGE